MAELTDDDILAELGVSIEPKQVRARTPREERIIAGFKDIVNFRDEHGRPPQHGEDRDIFERIYAVRLDRLRAQPESCELLADMDRYGLLSSNALGSETPVEELNDCQLLAELGIEGGENDVTQLRHVRSYQERSAAEEIANHTRCVDFDTFQPLFKRIQNEIENGVRATRPFGNDASIVQGDFFILRGQLAYVAGVGEAIKAPNGQFDARLRVIYSNGTESNLLSWSLQRALYKDDAARRISEPSAGPLFEKDSATPLGEDEFLASGTLYVLRSRSTHPNIAANREIIHKIGITSGSVETRISGAADDSTYLLAEVDIVATYKLYNVHRMRLEKLIHRLFDSVRFDAEIPNRFGKMVRPREWFLVPIEVIDDVVARISDGSIVDMIYDASKAKLVKVANPSSI